MGERLLDFPVELYPKSFRLVYFPVPGFLAGVNRGDGISEMRFGLFIIPGEGLTGVTVHEKRVNGPFAKMLAKIAYCYAVAEKGADYFDGNPIRDLLRSDRDDIFNFVGSSADREKLPTVHIHGLYFRKRGKWLTVLVHLFASLSADPAGAIPYEVVVGKLTGEPSQSKSI